MIATRQHGPAAATQGIRTFSQSARHYAVAPLRLRKPGGRRSGTDWTMISRFDSGSARRLQRILLTRCHYRPTDNDLLCPLKASFITEHRTL